MWAQYVGHNIVELTLEPAVFSINTIKFLPFAIRANDTTCALY
jgi:hypothetical protein